MPSWADHWPLPSPEGGPLPSAPLLPSYSFPIPSRSPSRHPARPPGPLPGAVHKVSDLSDRKEANLKVLSTQSILAGALALILFYILFLGRTMRQARGI